MYLTKLVHPKLNFIIIHVDAAYSQSVISLEDLTILGPTWPPEVLEINISGLLI